MMNYNIEHDKIDKLATLIVINGVLAEFKKNGDISIYTDGDVRIEPAVLADTRSKSFGVDREIAETPIGTVMPDGTLYAGLSPSTGKPMFTTHIDEPLTMSWHHAMKRHLKGLNRHGHEDWRTPSLAELNMLYENRDLLGGFNTSAGKFGGYYLSADECYQTSAYSQRFCDGHQDNIEKHHKLALRCVRG